MALAAVTEPHTGAHTGETTGPRPAAGCPHGQAHTPRAWHRPLQADH